MWKKCFWLFLVFYQLTAYSHKIIVGLSADYPPFEFKQGDKVVGFDVDIAEALAKELGADVEVRDMGFSSLLNSLDQGNIDLIISSMTATPERRKKFDFSIPYHFDELAVLYRADNPIEKQTLSGKIIACQMGSAMQTWLSTQAPTSKIVAMDLVPQMVEALKAGHVDGVLVDAVQAKEFIKNSKNLSFSIVGPSREGSSVVMKKGSVWGPKINTALTRLKQNGTLDALEKKWMESSPPTTSHTFLKDLVFIAKGLPITFLYSFLSIVLGGLLGTCFAISRHLKHGTRLIDFLISILRGTPILLQLGFIYFSLPALTGIKLSILAAGVITFGINSAAYIAEILRSGLQSLPEGQFEACQVLGISKWYSWKDIILPQVLRNVFPSLINEVVTLTKETALISVLGEMDILRRAQALAAETYDYFFPMCLAGLIYYVLIKTIEFIGKTIEKGGIMLKIVEATKAYKNHTILDHVSFSLKPGKIVALAGPSGSGKSTLLRCIQGLEVLDSGTITRNGTIGFIFQDFKLFPHLTVLENVAYALRVTKKLSPEKAKTKAQNILEQLGLQNFYHKMPHQLSGGQRQRVAIARALLLEPDLLLCDEPTSGLDGISGKNVTELFLELKKRGVTMLIASHDLDFVRSVADRVIVLKKATLVKDFLINSQNQKKLNWNTLLE